MHFLVDANVLIDYAQTDPKVLTLVAKHLGPVHVPKDVLDEVDQLGEEACARLGLLIVDGTLAQIMEAGVALRDQWPAERGLVAARVAAAEGGPAA